MGGCYCAEEFGSPQARRDYDLFFDSENAESKASNQPLAETRIGIYDAI